MSLPVKRECEMPNPQEVYDDPETPQEWLLHPHMPAFEQRKQLRKWLISLVHQGTMEYEFILGYQKQSKSAKQAEEIEAWALSELLPLSNSFTKVCDMVTQLYEAPTFYARNGRNVLIGSYIGFLRYFEYSERRQYLFREFVDMLDRDRPDRELCLVAHNGKRYFKLTDAGLEKYEAGIEIRVRYDGDEWEPAEG